jgi:hypothetical protein
MNNFTADDLIGLKFEDNGRGGYELAPATSTPPMPEHHQRWADGFQAGWAAACEQQPAH